MQSSFSVFHSVYPELKFWASVVGGLWMVFRGINWLKSIKDNDLVHIQLGVNEIKSELKEQTSAVCKELSDLRCDFRTYVAPQLIAAKRRK
jgi:hypothetical protein